VDSTTAETSPLKGSILDAKSSMPGGEFLKENSSTTPLHRSPWRLCKPFYAHPHQHTSRVFTSFELIGSLRAACSYRVSKDQSGSHLGWPSLDEGLTWTKLTRGLSRHEHLRRSSKKRFSIPSRLGRPRRRSIVRVGPRLGACRHLTIRCCTAITEANLTCS
jgi:hypothetical protein